MKQFLTQDCKKFIHDLIELTNEQYTSDLTKADSKGKRDMQMPPTGLYPDIGEVFNTVKDQGGFYGSVVANISTMSGSPLGKNATVYLGQFLDFNTYTSDTLFRRLPATDQKIAYDLFLGRQAITAIHELIHFTFGDVELARAIAAKKADTGTRFSYADPIAASKYWDKELQQHCGPNAKKSQ